MPALRSALRGRRTLVIDNGELRSYRCIYQPESNFFATNTGQERNNVGMEQMQTFPRTYKSASGPGWTGVQLALPLAIFHSREPTGAPAIMRTIMAHIAHGVELPPGRTKLRVEAKRDACFGYVLVYAGDGTPRERRAFQVALALAQELQDRLYSRRPELLAPMITY